MVNIKMFNPKQPESVASKIKDKVFRPFEKIVRPNKSSNQKRGPEKRGTHGK